MEGSYPAVLAAASIAGVDRCLPRRRCTSGGGAGVRHGDDAARRQDRRPRQRLRADRQAAGVRAGRHRQLRRRPSEVLVIADRSRSRGVGGGGSAVAGRARRAATRRRSADAVGARLARAVAERRSSGSSPRCPGARRHRRVAARASARSSSSTISHDAIEHRRRDRAGASRALRRARRRNGCRACATPARCSSAPTCPKPLGDYVAGPNHVLPTGGTARFVSPLGVYDFVKRTSIIGGTDRALRTLGPTVVRLAELEGLKRTRGRSRCDSAA